MRILLWAAVLAMFAVVGCGAEDAEQGPPDIDTETAELRIGDWVWVPSGGVVLCDATSCHGPSQAGGACGYPAQFGKQYFFRYKNNTPYNQACRYNGYLCGVMQCMGGKPSWATQDGGMYTPAQS